MNISKLYLGLTIKNYKELCIFLEIPVKGGNGKQIQLNELSRYCNFTKEGKKFTFNEIYEEPLEKIDLRYFPVQGVVVSNEAFFERIKKYEEASLDLQKIVILLAQWGNSEQISLLQKILKRMVEVDRGSSGSVAWLNLSWYPIQLVLYSAGIASVIANNYNALKVVLETPVRPVPDTVGKDLPINYIASLKISEISNVFKSLPGLLLFIYLLCA